MSLQGRRTYRPRRAPRNRCRLAHEPGCREPHIPGRWVRIFPGSSARRWPEKRRAVRQGPPGSNPIRRRAAGFVLTTHVAQSWDRPLEDSTSCEGLVGASQRICTAQVLSLDRHFLTATTLRVTAEPNGASRLRRLCLAGLFANGISGLETVGFNVQFTE